MLAALSTGHKLGLAAVAAVFILFALSSAFVFPRVRPDYPGRGGLKAFIAVTVLLFAGMMTAVVIFGRESEPAAAKEAATGPAPGAEESSTAPATTNAGGSTAPLEVTEKDFKIELAQKTLRAGSYKIDLRNKGKSTHNLVVSGPHVNKAATPTIGPGKSASLTVALVAGTYELYCAVPGHKQLGMDLKITVR
jgi:uncharacterized cupredoxin-like copper-binding protein